MIGKPRVANARDLRMSREVPRDPSGAFALPRDAKGERAQPAERQPGLVWRQVRAVENGAVAHGARELVRPRHHTTHDVAMPVYVFGERVDDHGGTERRRS